MFGRDVAVTTEGANRAGSAPPGEDIAHLGSGQAMYLLKLPSRIVGDFFLVEPADDGSHADVEPTGEPLWGQAQPGQRAL